MLAQLMKDMQDPEIMEEAKKMMNSKEFKKQMKTLEKDPKFKEAMAKTAKAMEDPQTAGLMAAQTEAMLRQGNKMQEQMGDEMKMAMEQMQNNPAMMREVGVHYHYYYCWGRSCCCCCCYYYYYRALHSGAATAVIKSILRSTDNPPPPPPRLIYQMQQLMSNPEELKKLMNDPTVKQYMSQFEEMLKVREGAARIRPR